MFQAVIVYLVGPGVVGLELLGISWFLYGVNALAIAMVGLSLVALAAFRVVLVASYSDLRVV